MKTTVPNPTPNLMEHDWFYTEQTFATSIGVVYSIHHPVVGSVIGSLSWGGELLSASHPELKLTWVAGIGTVKM